MNIPLNFCTKCGNPKNAGERVCRFCGHPFYEDTDNNFNVDGNPEDDISDMTQVDDSKIKEQTVASTKPQDDNQTEFVNPDDCQVDEVTNPSVSHEDNLIIEQQPATKEYVKIPKKPIKYVAIALIAIIIAAAAFFIFNQVKEDSPEKIVKQAFTELKHNNYDEFCSYLDISQKSKTVINKVLPIVMKFYGDNIKDVEIVNQEIDDDKAKVNLKLIFIDKNTQDLALDLVKIDGNWKIKPIGDIDAGLDMLLGIGSMFGLDIDNIGENIFGNLF